MKRNQVLRWAAPAVFLAALTVAVLLVRSGLRHDTGTTSTPVTPPISGTTASVSVTVTKLHPRSAGAKQYYTVQSGDTYGSIAAKHGTTVADLEQLNPGISSNALSVGQKIRIK